MYIRICRYICVILNFDTYCTPTDSDISVLTSNVPVSIWCSNEIPRASVGVISTGPLRLSKIRAIRRQCYQVDVLVALWGVS